MTKLTQKGVKFEWGDKQEAAFQLLKQELLQSEGFRRCVDAKRKGDFLWPSHQLMFMKKNYRTHDLELGASRGRNENLLRVQALVMNYWILVLPKPNLESSDRSTKAEQEENPEGGVVCYGYLVENSKRSGDVL
ncbi:hypothetical protein Tco_0134012 [Tanacetum coccineum]